MGAFEQSLDRLRERVVQPDFLANRGLGNEVGFYVFHYPAERELDMRTFVGALVADSARGVLPCRIMERNLWQVFLEICEKKRILDRIPPLEEKRGSDDLLARLQTIATPETFVSQMDWRPHTSGDVLLITGVGQVYPFMRAHAILENAQHVFADVPTVLCYPGEYDGQSLTLFGRIHDSNYYRAFDLI